MYKPHAAAGSGVCLCFELVFAPFLHIIGWLLINQSGALIICLFVYCCGLVPVLMPDLRGGGGVVSRVLVPVLVLNAGHRHRHPGSCPKIGLYIYIYNRGGFWGSFPGASAGACASALHLAPAQAPALAPGKLPQNRSVLYIYIYRPILG